MLIITADKLDNQLWELQKATNRYKNTDPCADWVLFAVSRYINSGKATREFEKQFIKFPPEWFTMLIKTCLNEDRSDDGIIRTCKQIFNSRWNNE